MRLYFFDCSLIVILRLQLFVLVFINTLGKSVFASMDGGLMGHVKIVVTYLFGNRFKRTTLIVLKALVVGFKPQLDF